MAERRAYRVCGRVQGVGFRWWAQRMATGLGVCGAVWNEESGTVRVDAWADAVTLDELERLLENGPPGARVDAVERLDPPAAPQPTDFRIAR